jgi:murein DD-endopeptidase MepM/ murein hydrolase activator NlpD
VLGAGAAAAVLLVVSAFLIGVQLGERSAGAAVSSPSDLARLAVRQKAEVEEMRARVQERIDAMAARIGQINAQLVRLDAFGKHLADMASIDSREFDFGFAPAMGGPESGGAKAEDRDLSTMIDSLESDIARREAQMGVLESVMLQRELRKQIVPEGRPVRRGYLSSGYGTRQDPFNGRAAFHAGIDFAGAKGDPIVAVAAGVVTFAGVRAGYGRVIDVTHGDGYVTRYAHNERLTVKAGETVTRGQQVAVMGSSGRSTGPHVHFEVLRNGRPVNPLAYINR